MNQKGHAHNPSRHGVGLRVGLKEIARISGFSTTTVSLVLQGRSQERRIATNTVTTIQRIASELGYVPNLGAQNLTSSNCIEPHMVVAIITPIEFPLESLRPLVEGIRRYNTLSNETGTRSMRITIETYPIDNLEGSLARMTQNAFHACIFANTSVKDDEYLQNARIKVPYIIFNRRIPGLNCITRDFINMGKSAGLRLKDAGCSTPLVVRPERMSEVEREKHSGFSKIFSNYIQILIPRFDLIVVRDLVRARLEHDPIDGIYMIVPFYWPAVQAAISSMKLPDNRDFPVAGAGAQMEALQDLSVHVARDMETEMGYRAATFIYERTIKRGESDTRIIDIDTESMGLA
jgi:DNA-binding LacI/PurR family transcriptional regulator